MTKLKGTQTEKNLLASFAGESQARNRYTYVASQAKKEGFRDVADAFRYIAKVDEQHEKRYKKLAENIEKNEVFKKAGKVKWACRNCGYVHEGAPEKCPACLHEKPYFEIKAENY